VLKTLKLASAKYLDALPTTGNEHGRAFRDLEWEKKILEIAQNSKIGAQFGGKYFALDVRVVRLPRHGASCPVGMGVSCSADRNIKAKITQDGVFLEAMETNPGQLHSRRPTAASKTTTSSKSISGARCPRSSPSSPNIRSPPASRSPAR
jgi:hypothetical protein